MRTQVAAFGAVLAAGGLAASALILPSASEQALMLFKDKEFGQARALYERYLGEGEQSVAVVIPLIELYLQVGEVERALALAEHFVAQHPGNADARRMLAGLHKSNEMPASHLADLEALARLRPEPATLRELAEAYHFYGRVDEQVAVLTRLAKDDAAGSTDLVDLVRAHVAAGRSDEALATMTSYLHRFPEDSDVEAVLLHVGLQIQAGRRDAAAARATAWLKGRNDPAAAAALAALLIRGGLAKAVPVLLEAFADSGDPAVLDALTESEQATGQAPRALDRLAELHRRGRLPAAALPMLVDLALTLDRPDVAFDAVGPRAIGDLPNELIVAFAQAAVAANRTGLVQQALADLKEAFGPRQPVLLATLALLLNDRDEAAGWVAVAEAAPLPAAETGQLVALMIGLGRGRDALARLDTLVRDRAVMPVSLPVIAAALAEAGLAPDALPVMLAARQSLPSLDSDRAWAVIALRLGQVKAVTAWLDEAERLTNGALPEGLYASARDARVYDFALMLAQRMHARAPGLANRLNLAEALVLNGRWREAEPILAPMKAAAGLDMARYVEVLTFAYKAGAPVGEELRTYWRERYAAVEGVDRDSAFHALLDLADFAPILPELAERARSEPLEWLAIHAEAAVATGHRTQLLAMLEADLAKPGRDEAIADERLAILARLAGDEATLPHLRRLADRLAGDWVFAYAEMLERLGQRAELIAYHEERASNPALPRDERRDIVADLLEMGGKDAAERALRRLADAAAPGDEAVEELLFLWGPRPGDERAAWLQARARAAADPAERAAWLRHMMAAEIPGIAADAVAVRELAAAPVELVQAWGEAVSALAPAAIATRLKAAVEVDQTPDHLALYGDVAYDAERWDVAQAAYARLARHRPGDVALHRRLAETAQAANSPAAARDALAHILVLAPDDSRAALDLGDLLLRLDGLASRDGEARAIWLAGLEALERSPAAGDFEQRRLRADLLHRLRRNGESAELYAALLAERPGDVDLKADLSGALIEARKFDAAGSLLGQPQQK